MLTRLYVDNYKCLVNFDLRLGREHLLMGANGTGKSSVFEVLSALRKLHFGDARVEDAFPSSTLTRWQRRTRQVFELEAQIEGATYRYRLEVAHELERARSRVEEESLHLGELPLYSSKHGEAQLYRDDGSQGPKVLSDWSRSGLPFLLARPENRRLTLFKQWLGRVLVVRLDPRRMVGRSEREEVVPSEDLSNFASWYRHLTQERPDDVFKLHDSLRRVLDGFDALFLKSAGEGVRLLRSRWRHSSEEDKAHHFDEYAFEELSDGQRALIGLYALLHAMAEGGATLCLDEPDNFVGLREVQPFLSMLQEQERLQLLIVSHHPEVINLLAPDAGLSFKRLAGSPVRVSTFSAWDDAAMSPAEWVARGWDDGQ